MANYSGYLNNTNTRSILTFRVCYLAPLAISPRPAPATGQLWPRGVVYASY
jgi:hypothetical protein